MSVSREAPVQPPFSVPHPGDTSAWPSACDQCSGLSPTVLGQGCQVGDGGA